MKYECDKCGACCRHLIVEAYDLDVLREPRLLNAQQGSVRVTLDDLQADESKCILLSCGHPCALLGPDNLCQIYPTRPDTCVEALPGEEFCQTARRMAGLPLLKPIEEKERIT